MATQIIPGPVLPNWILVESRSVTAADTTTQNFTGLDGDAAVLYLARFTFVHAGAGSVYYTLEPNGLTSNQFSTRHYGSGATDAAAATTDLRLVGTSASSQIRGQCLIWATTGVKRSVLVESMQSSATVVNIEHIGGTWTDTTTNITSLRFTASVANGIGIDSKIELYEQGV